jgi:hypothetical protein
VTAQRDRRLKLLMAEMSGYASSLIAITRETERLLRINTRQHDNGPTQPGVSPTVSPDTARANKALFASSSTVVK